MSHRPIFLRQAQRTGRILWAVAAIVLVFLWWCGVRL
jgi:hypothetical protein